MRSLQVKLCTCDLPTLSDIINIRAYDDHVSVRSSSYIPYILYVITALRYSTRKRAQYRTPGKGVVQALLLLFDRERVNFNSAPRVVKIRSWLIERPNTILRVRRNQLMQLAGSYEEDAAHKNWNVELDCDYCEHRWTNEKKKRSKDRNWMKSRVSSTRVRRYMYKTSHTFIPARITRHTHVRLKKKKKEREKSSRRTEYKIGKDALVSLNDSQERDRYPKNGGELYSRSTNKKNICTRDKDYIASSCYKQFPTLRSCRAFLAIHLSDAIILFYLHHVFNAFIINAPRASLSLPIEFPARYTRRGSCDATIARRDRELRPRAKPIFGRNLTYTALIDICKSSSRELRAAFCILYSAPSKSTPFRVRRRGSSKIDCIYFIAFRLPETHAAKIIIGAARWALLLMTGFFMSTHGYTRCVNILYG
ncbi:unnamed protein product [Trichogramma brassicae]|uniref:Uncharacterized protein n=1 Tax=Trichogramma brassicae TaxID=86971 RepID=A0A6H5I423_9HYME|nr:unnamed protein product [Trichogramma brassicae]